jgi:N-acetylmuramoyl-L-alanine amidase
MGSSHRSEAWADSHYAAAAQLRDALNARPEKNRTRHEYQQVIDAYRRIYNTSPTSGKADPSVTAVADLMVQMGRQFQDDEILHKAIRQYEFLRREYPGSGHRFEALFTIGQIYKDDLNDPRDAKASFEEFLQRYPHHHLAEDARKALADADQQIEAQASPKAPQDKTAEAAVPSKADADQPADDADADKTSHVTGIRHWSTPNYTRVAIDLDQDVKYDSARLAHPDRIYFDLFDTKLDSALEGKSFDVDDSFLKTIRIARYAPGKTRVVFDVDNVADYNAFLLSNPTRLVIDIHGKQDGKTLARKGTAESAETAAAKPDAAPAAPDKLDSPDKTSATTVADSATVPKTIVDDDDSDDADAPALRPVAKVSGPAGHARARRRAPERIREAEPTAAGDRSLIRALGLKIGKIVIDPGHGGHDTGCIGPDGLEEKDLVLDVSKRLGKLLQTRLGAEVAYTRTDDTFVPLETRTAIANREQADLFISIHANSSHDADARGVETYYLNFTSSPDALEVAARENAGSENSIHELQDLVKKIALKEKIEESREFASDVESSLHSGLAAKNPGIRDRGVKKAPFIVLIGANMPSILAEISFISNPGDERRLRTSAYRQRIAESLYRGISKYVSGLGGVKYASEIDKGSGQ